MRRSIFLAGIFLAVMVCRAESQEIYRWIDETGKIYLVDEIRNVPKRYRSSSKVYRVSSGLKEKRPGTEQSVRGTKPEASPEAEQPEAPTPPDRSARIEALGQMQQELGEEKARLKVLETRYKTKSSRAVIYTRRIQELDKQAEAIQKELDTLLQEEQ